MIRRNLNKQVFPRLKGERIFNLPFLLPAVFFEQPSFHLILASDYCKIPEIYEYTHFSFAENFNLNM